MTSELTVGLLAQAIGIAFAVGIVLLLALTVMPGTRLVARSLWPVLASEAVILSVGVLPWLLPHAALLPLLVLAGLRLGYESGSVHSKTSGDSFCTSYAAVLAGVVGLSWSLPFLSFCMIAGSSLLLALVALLLTRKESRFGSLVRFVTFPLLPMAAFSQVASDERLAPYLVLSFFLVEMFDSFSLLGGKLYGRTALVPRLSPRKTWEGLATGCGATLLAALSLATSLALPQLSMLLVVAVVVPTAIAGDLMGSIAKRHAGVKDYPSVMTVQGGLLDIADAWLVSGPCVVLLAFAAQWT